MYSETERNKFEESIRLPLILIGILFIVHIIRVTTDWDLIYWGIFPRKIYGLKGILTSPLIHGDWKHLISNSIPLLGLSVACMYFYRSVALKGFTMIYILTGISVWLLGNFFDDNVGNPSHIGASGVVYGLVAFVFWNGLFVRSRASIVLALIVVVLYSGMWEGILPNQEGISWESHLFGGLVGVFAAYYYKSELLEELEEEKRQNPQTWGDGFGAMGDIPFRNNRADDAQKTTPFLPRDIFEKTKEERRREQEMRWESDDTLE